MRHFRRFLLCLVVGVTALGAFYFVQRRDPISVLHSPDKVLLYSLDGDAFRSGREVPGAELFHHVAVLGKVEILDSDERLSAVSAVKDGIEEGGVAKDCFRPRHGLRVETGGRTIDFVICFECGHIEIYDGKQKTGRTVALAPQRTLNRLLRKANVPLSQGMVEDAE